MGSSAYAALFYSSVVASARLGISADRFDLGCTLLLLKEVLG